MKRIHTLCGAAILATCLIGWAALAWARSDKCPSPVLPSPQTDEAVRPVSPQLPEETAVVLQPLPLCAVHADPLTDFCYPLCQSEPTAQEFLTDPELTTEPWPEEPPTPTTTPEPPMKEVVLEAHKEAPVPTQQSSGERRQDSAVCLEWKGPAVIQVGQKTDYTLIVRNTCSIAVRNVRVQVTLPENLRTADTDQQHDELSSLVWSLGTLAPGQQQPLHMQLVAISPGDFTPQASVTFTGGAAMRIRARQPQLALDVSAPSEVKGGELATFALTVRNLGDGVARRVQLRAHLSEGLQPHTSDVLQFEIGDLRPGDRRQLTLPCTARASGLQWCEAVATARGESNGVRDTAELKVAMPCLDVRVQGPRLRYVGRRALYTFTVTNTGEAIARNVVLTDRVPDGLKVLAASGDGRQDPLTNKVSWALGELSPGTSQSVKLEVQAVGQGKQLQQVQARSACGSHTATDMVTSVKGLAALRLELVDAEDPIETQAPNRYEVRIANTGSLDETGVRLMAKIPEGMRFTGADGPVRYLQQGRMIHFEPIPRLKAGTEAVFQLRVQAVQAGTVRFEIQVTSSHLSEPVIEMEPTRIYADETETLGR